MLKLAIFILTFGSVGLICSQTIPLALERFQRIQVKKVKQAEQKLDKMFIAVERKRLFLIFTVSPMIMGVVAFFLFNNLTSVFIALIAGFILPAIVIKKIEALRKMRLASQLVDGLMVLSSSLKGGLSFLQAIEVLVEEMPAPISQEFGLILRENKMGVTLEESLGHLNERLDLEEVKLLTNSILVARETGGDLTKVLLKLSTTIRDNAKLKDKMRTLTLTGRLQGLVMSILPFVFLVLVTSYNRQHFEIMLQNEKGRTLLIIAVILQVSALILIRKFSRIRI